MLNFRIRPTPQSDEDGVEDGAGPTLLICALGKKTGFAHC